MIHSKSAFRQEVAQAFPHALRAASAAISKALSCHGAELHQQQQPVVVEGRLLLIPSRVYVNNVDSLFSSNLTSLQQTMLRCLMLRHHSGFVRQRYLEYLLLCSDYFITPYTLHLLGEYVIEIVEVLEVHIRVNLMQYVRFIAENPRYWEKVKSKVASYWDAYYRISYPRLSSYPAMKLVDLIERAKKLVC